MRYPESQAPSGYMTGFEENRGSPLSSALQELLTAIHERSLEAGHRSRNIRRRPRVTDSPRRETRQRRKLTRSHENRSISFIKDINKTELALQTGDYPLSFVVVKSDGGDHDLSHSISNILRTDSSVYSSLKKQNINVLLKFNPQGNGLTDSSCVVTNVTIKSPKDGFTAPCSECMIFFSQKPILIEDLSKYDDFEESDYENCLNSSKVWPVPHLLPVAYFLLQPSADYSKTFQFNFRSTRYIGLKLLRSHTGGDNIDIQHISISGFTGARSFAQAELI